MARTFKLRGEALITCILSCSALSFLLFGYDQGLFGGVLSGQRFQDMLGQPNSTMTGLVTAIYDIGCALGAVVAFIWAERLGRVRSLIIANFIVVIGAVIQTASVNYAMMLVARIIAGTGVGLSTVVVPILQAETLPPFNRGAFMIVQAFAINFGVAVAGWICFAFLYVPNSGQWRIPIVFQVVFALGVLCFSPWLPADTPRWLGKEGRWDEARDVQARLLDVAEDDPQVEEALKDIRDNIEEEASMGRVAWGEVFTQGKTKNLQRVLLGMAPYLMNQWSGINSITYYLPVILETYLGFSQSLSLIIAAVAFTQYALFTCAPYWFIDRLGRIKTIFISAAGCSCCMAVIAGLLSMNTQAGASAAVAFIFFYQDFFAIGILPVSWSYSSELQPIRVRSKSNAVGVAAHWLSNFVVVMVTPIGLATIDWQYYLVWCFVCAGFCPIIYFFFVETSGRTLEEIDRIFLDDSHIIFAGTPYAKVKREGLAKDTEASKEDMRQVQSTSKEKNHAATVEHQELAA